MSSEVAAKWMNSSAPCTSRFLPSFAFSQYSIALTSWLVSASIFLICSPSFSENPATSAARLFAVAFEKGFSSAMPGAVASTPSQASSTRTRYLISANSLK